MRRIRINNPSVNQTYKTSLASDYSSGTSLTVVNNSAFAANDILIVGEPTEELTEAKQLSSVSSSTGITLSGALNFSHSKGTSVYKTLWDQVVPESNMGSGWVVLDTVNIQWDNENNQTIYFDSNGADSTSYRFRFYNSVTTTYSDYSPTLTGAGFTRQQVGFMIQQVRKIANDRDAKIVDDDEIIRYFNRAQDIVYAHNPRYWFLLVDTYKQGTGIPVTAATDVYSLATYSTFGNLEVVRYNYSSGGTNRLYTLERKTDIEFDALTTDLNRGKDDWTTMYKLLPADDSSANGYIQIDPIPLNSSVGTLYPKYYEKMANLDSVDDATQIPLPAIIEDFAISEIERVKGNETKAQQYLELFLGPKDQRGGFEDITGLKLLDKMDSAQKRTSGQPRSLVNFRGRYALTRTFGNPRMNRDNEKEFYMD